MRNIRIDLLRTLAIVAVVLYHMGFMPYGYLGVDIFFVISGYFLMKGYLKGRKQGHGYWRMLFQRVARLWPIVVIASAVCLVVGIGTMLPDDLENLGESVIASNVFMTNMLSMITTKDYWAVSNNFRPLMHTWYLGVLMQAYVVLLLFFRVTDRFGRKVLKYSCAVLAAVSLIAYLLPLNSAWTFYIFFFRLFEILAGSLLVMMGGEGYLVQRRGFRAVSWGAMALIAFLLILNRNFMNEKARLVLVVCLTCLYLKLVEWNVPVKSRLLSWLSIPGKCSLSIYIWHQIILAFYRYIVISPMTGMHWLIYLALLVVFTVASYQLLELKLGKLQKSDRKRGWLLGVTVLVCAAEVFGGGVLYLRAGVIRDVPELGVTIENAHRGMHAEYVDRVYRYNADFSGLDKTRVFIYGDSMGRDWGNILLESQYADALELSYVHPTQYVPDQHDAIIQKADVVFFAPLGDSLNLPEAMKKVDPEKLYVVGIKNFGECNGNFYNRRNCDDYFASTVKMGKSFVEGKTYYQQNDDQRAAYGDHYIDMITPLLNEAGEMPVFSDEKMYISADCEHLTQAGARYYAKVLDLAWIVNRA